MTLVHFQNAAALVDRLTLASVHNYRVQFYTDSDHSINTHNANREIYYLLTDYLWEGLVYYLVELKCVFEMYDFNVFWYRFGGEEYDHVRRETHGQVVGSVDHH